MGLNIKNERVERLAEEVARLAGESKTEAIRRALEERMSRLALRAAPRDRAADLLRFLEREVWPSIPARLLGRKRDKRAVERILGYGKDGA